ncbi:sialate O-acetylesterase [Pontiellaceae bacterium B1224]|nr:sialate O-acetylesterase [Pontiellaceae bacterium B1224]
MNKWIILAWCFICSTGAFALELPSIFADKMVLQREQMVPVWGMADAGTTVTVKFAGQEKTAMADSSNHWKILLDPMPASAESRTMTVSCPNNPDIQYSDVLVGEVWFAGGQSNMYRPFRMLTAPAADPFYEPITEYLRNERDTANDPLFRQYRSGQMYEPYEAETIGRGNWSQAIPGEVNEICATAYFFGRELRRELDVPVALISCNKGGTLIEPWMAPKSFERSDTLKTYYSSKMDELKEKTDAWDHEAEMAHYKKAMAEREKAVAEGKKVANRGPRKPEDPMRDRGVPGTLYNGMVHPIAPYAMKGVIWYQGESNSGNDPQEYGNRLEALIEGWRDSWGQEELLFIWCQLANYKAVNEEPLGDEVDGWVWVQNGQREALRVPNTGMAVLNDIGEEGDVHPKNKIDAGKRLSLWALNKAYGRDLVYSGPLFKEAKVKGSKIYIKFDHVGSGLMTGHKHLMDATVEVDEPLQYFQICDASNDWKWAQAKIVGKDVVEVWHDDIKKPVEVRYAWSPNPEGANLYNKEGLPTSVFTTGRLK